MIPSDPLAEWARCDLLRQADLDRLIASGIPVLSLAGNLDGRGYCVMRDQFVPHAAARRFELQRYDETAGESACAYIALALDRHGIPLDLVAFHGGPAPFVGAWFGRVPVLGMEHLGASRFPKPLVVHPDPFAWLRAGREGICIVDPIQAAPLLRDAGEIEVGSFAERRRLLDAMAVRLPRVTVRPTERRAAA